MSSNLKPLETAILFLVFNRPDTTQRVFSAIKSARPKRLYLAADGPRPDRTGEEACCSEVRGIISNVDWPCDVKMLFRDNNLGCKQAVGSAIDWFFQHEDKGIILEDDCEPSATFYKYCECLLHKYEHDMRIMMISGDNFYPHIRRTTSSYYFTKYVHCWGWATWKRAWKHYDPDMSHWPCFRDAGYLADILSDKSSIRYWERQFDSTYEGKISSWAYTWMLAMWMQSGMSIIPEKNMVKNIGIGENSTHTKSIDPQLEKVMIQHNLTFPLLDPILITIDQVADIYVQKNIIQTKKSLKQILIYINKLFMKLRTFARGLS